MCSLFTGALCVTKLKHSLLRAQSGPMETTRQGLTSFLSFISFHMLSECQGYIMFMVWWCENDELEQTI